MKEGQAVIFTRAERIISKLKNSEKQLRISLSPQYKLANLALVAIENDIVDKIDMDNFINAFVAQKGRKMLIFFNIQICLILIIFG